MYIALLFVFRVLIQPSIGAGHPGEDDIGGLVLVCTPFVDKLKVFSDERFGSWPAQPKNSMFLSLHLVVLQMVMDLQLRWLWEL